MRVRRRPRIVFCTAAAVVAASGLALVDAAGAAPGVPVAPTAPGQGGAPRVCIEPSIRFGETPNAPSVATRTIPGGLPSGRYRVSVTTSDGYPGRTETAFDIETSERVTVYGQVTQDLADGVESDTKTLTFEVSFTEPQTTVVVSHTPANGPDSVRVDQLCWERLGDLEVSTTTSAVTSTTATTATTAPAAGGGTTTVPGLVLQTVPGLVFLDGDTTTTASGACSASGGAGAGSGAGSGVAGSTTGGATAASTCPGGSTVLASQLPLAPTANAVTSSPSFTG